MVTQAKPGITDILRVDGSVTDGNKAAASTLVEYYPTRHPGTFRYYLVPQLANKRLQFPRVFLSASGNETLGGRAHIETRKKTYRKAVNSEERPPVEYRELDLLAIRFKPVAFIPHDPEVWFADLETQFVARKVRSQRSKYFYAVEEIPGDRMSAIRDIILKPPEKEA
ncbi:unnamed protein product [Echinostoma caproni]|uniref:Transposase n=1 Tax=Echinostoma caproni TaxID=27848 RepID=A0A183AY32_9TREM|nr:unnamed protein product [Echinostoma caproni]